MYNELQIEDKYFKNSNICNDIINQLKKLEKEINIESFLYYGSDTWINDPKYTIDILYDRKILTIKSKSLRKLKELLLKRIPDIVNICKEIKQNVQYDTI